MPVTEDATCPPSSTLSRTRCGCLRPALGGLRADGPHHALRCDRLRAGLAESGSDDWIGSDDGSRSQERSVDGDGGGRHAQYRLNLLIRALERHGAPCVLALDEAERLRSPEAAALISTLLRRGPRNLHVGMAFRVRSARLDIAMFALEGRAATVTAEELRFSKSEISRFFDRRLSRQEGAAAHWGYPRWFYSRRRSRGGPVQLAICAA